MGHSGRDAAADVLRGWALDEDLKARVMASPALAAVATRIAERYTAGETVHDAIAAAKRSVARGHLVSLEYAGESVRDAELAKAETAVFLDLIDQLRQAGIRSTVSFDLSHIGSIVSPSLALENALLMADALAPLGTALMISAEGSERTDLVLDLYDTLSASGASIGITLQARLHRSEKDLERLLEKPGPIRLVKGAFLEAAEVAYPRGSSELHQNYLRLADQLLDAGHPVSFATHDAGLIDEILRRHPGLGDVPQVEFEMLLGLGTSTLDRLRADNLTTREYSIFGGEWWLYVLNRIAEDPERVFDAIVAAGN
ncbi:proline dehydrogenase [Arthrobacter pascens]|uniref:proline dehydrogenase family protein n=1 Tax=Arthrobacter pascens TaxID=1677 RepID=UPI00277F9F90|nr:proline dehydrogenase family protein [Arthrobacter pascens]MDQ0634146.1 proline dehydrogenase [Arthrobacter pascens]